MDFYTGLAEIEASTFDEPPPKNRAEAVWQWLVSEPSRISLPPVVRPLISLPR
jgi:amino acid transporter